MNDRIVPPFIIKTKRGRVHFAIGFVVGKGAMKSA
jgi:hypothetical protein